MIFHGDCRDWLKTLDDESVDSMVTDPPYGMGKQHDPRKVLAAWLEGDSYQDGSGFMGRAWDSMVPGPDVWSECFRVMKPGAYGVVFASTRTVDWLGIALRLAGFEIRDCLHWCYWSGFVKSLNFSQDARFDVPTEFREQWNGFGTAIKPAVEPALLIRKPFPGTVANNVLTHGVGGLNIDGCRFAYGDTAWPGPNDRKSAEAKHASVVGCLTGFTGHLYGRMEEVGKNRFSKLGRYPANLYHCPKASRKERERGCQDLPTFGGHQATGRKEDSDGLKSPRAGAGRTAEGRANIHPTVKPARLMRWLTRLVTPPGGLVIDPFVGSGTTAVAAALEGFRFAGAELADDETLEKNGIPRDQYIRIARARFESAQKFPEEWADTAPGCRIKTPKKPVKRDSNPTLFDLLERK